MIVPYEEVSSQGVSYTFEIDTQTFLDKAVLPNDPGFAKQWHLFNTGQASGLSNEDITAPEAWVVRTGSPDVVVAVIDEGIQLNHPDLVNNLWTNPGEIPGNGIDDDENGYVDDVHGYNFSSGKGDVFASPEFSHGTHVAGIIGAEGNNGIGVTGVSWDVQLMSLDVLGPGENKGRFSTVWEAIYYAADNGADVINMSLGADVNMTLEQFKARDPITFAEGFNALQYAVESGVTVVVAAGNASNSFDTDWISLPAIYSDVLPGVISVASVGNTGELASYSNYGSKITIAAPGGDFGDTRESLILSTYPFGDYRFLAGTSMAAPVVAGAVALVKAENPDLAPAQIQTLLEDTAWMYRDLEGFVHNGYFLDLSDALSNAKTFAQGASGTAVSSAQVGISKLPKDVDLLTGLLASTSSRQDQPADVLIDGTAHVHASSSEADVTDYSSELGQSVDPLVAYVPTETVAVEFGAADIMSNQFLDSLTINHL
jgi:subtilisin family serine protease